MKQIIKYLTDKKINFEIINEQLTIKRDVISYDLRQFIKCYGLKTYELDTIIIIY